MREIHPDWDEGKALAHLAQLRGELDKFEAVYDAFADAADKAGREVERCRDRIAYCDDMFSKPRDKRESS
jgi:hypothetical protein